MSQHTISIKDAAAQLVELVRDLGADDEVILTENDKPVATILPIVTGPIDARPKRVVGNCKGLLSIVKEDDEHLDDFKDYM